MNTILESNKTNLSEGSLLFMQELQASSKICLHFFSNLF